MKEIVPIKVIVNLNGDGTLKDGVIQYKLSTDGIRDEKARTIGIQNAMDEETVSSTNTLIQKAIYLAKLSEGIS